MNVGGMVSSKGEHDEPYAGRASNFETPPRYEIPSNQKALYRFYIIHIYIYVFNLFMVDPSLGVSMLYRGRG